MSGAGALKDAAVLHVSPALDVRGGVSRVVANIFASSLNGEVRLLHVASHRDGSKGLKLVAALTGLVRMLALLIAGRVDLVHLHCGDAPSPCRKFVFQCLARAFGRPTLVHLHTALFMEQYRAMGRLRQAVARALLTRAARVVCLSPQWRERALEIAPEARVEILPNAVPLPARVATGSAPGQPMRVVFMGSLGPRKGAMTLLEALSGMVRGGSGPELDICGSDGEAALREAAARLGVADRVRFHGWVRGPDKAAILDAADVLALPSSGEGLPMSLLEAMALGLAVVATPVGGVPELVRDRENGLVVPVGDTSALARALETLAADAELRRRLGEAGRRTVAEGFAMDTMTARLQALYEEILREARA